MNTQLHTIYEVAQYLGVHHMTVRNWIRKGKVSVIRLPGFGIRITGEELTRITTPITEKPRA